MIKKLICILSLVIALFLTGCEIKEEENKTDEIPNDKESAIDSEYIHLTMVKAKTINPILNTDKSVGYIMNLVYDSLFTIDENYDVVPQLVKEYEISDSGKSVSLTINDAKWHNGDSITSNDVKYSVGLIQSNSSSPYYNLVKDIESVYVIDNKNLNINFKEKYAFSVEKLTFPIVSKNQLSNKSNEEIIKDSNNLVGSGKYKIDRYKPREEMILSINEEYYKEIPKTMRDIEIKIVPDYESQIAMAIALSSDIVKIELDDMSKFYEKEFNINMFEGRGYEQIIFNYENEFLKNEDFRKALSYAINREVILKEAYIGYGKIVDFPLHSDSKYYNKDIKSLDYDLELSKKHLEKAKPNKEPMGSFIKEEKDEDSINETKPEEDNTKDSKKVNEKDIKKMISSMNLKIIVNKDNKERLKAAHIVSENLKAIGIKSNVSELTSDEMDKAIKDKSYDLALVGWEMSSVSDASTIIKNSGYYDKKLEKYLNSLMVATSEEQIKDIYTSIQNYVNEKVCFISLVNKFDYVVTNKRIDGKFKANEFDIYEGIDNLDIK